MVQELYRVNVGIKEKDYNIIIGLDIIAQIGEYVKSLSQKINNIVIITDSEIEKYSYCAIIKQSLEQNNIKTYVINIAGGESAKSFDNFGFLIERVLNYKPDRNWCLCALGGGVIGDLTGFVASVILRGIHFIQIPTTLLSQVDSSVGGKTAINSPHGKNLIGSFYQPILVISDLNILQSLPKREYLCGYAEVLKYACINNYEFFEYLEKNKTAIKEFCSKEIIAYLVKLSCETKAKIVAMDEKESGVRALLNLGHTFAHALEKVLGYSSILKHGEAVSVGIVLAFALSHKMGFCKKELIDKVKSHLKYIGLPTLISDIAPKGQNVMERDWITVDKLITAIYSDKKVNNNELTFILVRNIGDSFVKKGVAVETVRELLQDYI